MGVPRPYDTRRWKNLRPGILERDGYICQLRYERCTLHATEVDHIIDWRDGGDWYAADNLRAACKRCNVTRRNKKYARKRPPRAQSRNW